MFFFQEALQKLTHTYIGANGALVLPLHHLRFLAALHTCSFFSCHTKVDPGHENVLDPDVKVDHAGEMNLLVCGHNYPKTIHFCIKVLPSSKKATITTRLYIFNQMFI